MLKGVGASSGIGIGTIVCIREESLDYSKVVFQGEAEEKARLKEAVDTFCKVTQEMAEDIRQRVGEKESEILSGQIMMLSDPFMTGQMEEMSLPEAVQKLLWTLCARCISRCFPMSMMN